MADKIKRPLQQLNKVEKHIAKQVRMSKVIDHLYAEHKDQLDYTYKQAHDDGYSAGRGEADIEIDIQKKALEKVHKQMLLEQAKKHQARTTELKAEIESLKYDNLIGFIESKTPNMGILVDNWRQGWKWASNWMLLLIAYIQLYGVPPELIQLLPEVTQGKVTAALAILGFAFRFINQSKPKVLPLAPNQKGEA